MELRKLDINELKDWYFDFLHKDFISDEIKPLDNIENLVRDGRYAVYGIFEENEMLGYATFWIKKGINLVLLDYLGISSEYRNKGLGGKALQLIREMLGEIPFVMESELPVGDDPQEDDIRRRRIGFYERNGCSKIYYMATCGMKWQTLISEGRCFDQNEIARMHKALYEEGRDDVIIPINLEEEAPKPFWSK